MDWPGAEEISTRLASMLPPGLMDKSVDELPPEARGIVMNLMSQMQQMKQEHDQAVALLGDKEADRDIERQKIAVDRAKHRLDIDAELAKIREDYETKLLKIQADYETKMAAIASKEGSDPEAELAIRREEAERQQTTDLTKIAADFYAKMEKIQSDAIMQAQQMRMDQQHEQEEAKRKEREDKQKAEETKKQADEERFAKMFEQMQHMLTQVSGQKAKKVRLTSPSGRVWDAEVTEH